MLFDDFKDKLHPTEVIKWGVFDGFLVGLFIAIFAIIHAKREMIVSLSGGWELSASLFLMLLLSLSALITTVLVFTRPIYCIVNKKYKDSLLTILVTLLTIIAMGGFVFWSAPYFGG